MTTTEALEALGFGEKTEAANKQLAAKTNLILTSGNNNQQAAERNQILSASINNNQQAAETNAILI